MTLIRPGMKAFMRAEPFQRKSRVRPKIPREYSIMILMSFYAMLYGVWLRVALLVLGQDVRMPKFCFTTSVDDS